MGHRRMPDALHGSEDEQTVIRVVVADDDPAADELLEMIEIYARERCSMGVREMVASRRGSVRWWWGWTVAVEMEALLGILGKN